MNYKLVEDENKKIYYVKETTTDLNIKAFKEFSEARKYMKFLNLGGSFDGFTPAFILKSTSTSSSCKSRS